jgi:hypothetical protein
MPIIDDFVLVELINSPNKASFEIKELRDYNVRYNNGRVYYLYQSTKLSVHYSKDAPSYLFVDSLYKNFRADQQHLVCVCERTHVLQAKQILLEVAREHILQAKVNLQEMWANVSDRPELILDDSKEVYGELHA